MTSTAKMMDPVEPVYTIGLTGFIYDDVMFTNLYLDTVIVPIRRSFGPRDAMTIAGCHVKSIECDNEPGARFPKHFAKIQSYRSSVTNPSAGPNDPGRVVLLGKSGRPSDKAFIWCGTVAEYEKTWECD